MKKLAILIFLSGVVAAQQFVGTATFTGTLNAGNAQKTYPFRIGLVLPASCTVGEMLYKTNEPPGENVYACTSTNTWSKMGTPASYTAGLGISILGTEIQTDTAVVPHYSTGSSAPTHNCSVGQAFYVNTTTGALYWCKAANTWETFSGGSGTVTSVALSMPSIFTVSGSPVTTSGTLTASLNSQSANTVWAAPNGSSGAPSFRSLVAADIPSLDTSKITTGTFSSARLPASLVYSDQSNSYGGGAKQTFNASSTTAGAQIAAAALPSTPATGDLAVDSAASNTLKWYDGSQWQSAGGGGGSSFDPASTFEVYEEFVNGVTTSDRVGTHGWFLSLGTGTLTTATGQAYGMYRLGTGTTAGNSAIMYLGIARVAVDPAGTFDLRMRVRQNHVDSDTTVRAGLNCSSTAALMQPSEGIYVENVAGETAWYGVARNGGSETRASIGTNTQATWYRLRIRRVDSSTIGYTLNDGTEQTINTNVPTAYCVFLFAINNGAAASNKQLDVDYLYFRVTGLSR